MGEKTMRFLTRRLFAVLASASLLPLSASAQQGAFTDEFDLEDCSFSSEGDNPLFPLRPGFHRLLAGESDGAEVTVDIDVTRKTRTITLDLGGKSRRIKTRIVQELETEDGEVVEISQNYFARCKQTGDVFYFGEDVDIYEDGEVVSHDGAWLAGVDGTQPGLIMPGRFLLGSRYFQEIAANAMDRAEHTEMGVTLETEAGTFEGCVRTIETSPLEPGHESPKTYCPGVGLAVDSDVELVEFGRVKKHHGGPEDD
jgi:hypothetical protein